MRIYSKLISVVFFLLCRETCGLHAQSQAPLDWAAFRALVLNGHPEAQKADLLLQRAQAGLLSAKGGFDPKLYADYSGKAFKNKTYFQYTGAGVKWPIGLGIELKGNYNWATGNYLNPESQLPAAGQAAAGFNWTLGQGLLLDERRAGLKQSRIEVERSTAERDDRMNDLLFEAAKSFWSWTFSYNQRLVLESAYSLAVDRHAGVVESYRQGDKPAIDTLESYIQVQTRRLDLENAGLEWRNSALELLNYYWTEGRPLARITDLPPGVPLPDVPDARPGDVETHIAVALNRHPALRQYQSKREFLSVERRLKQEKKKPVLDLGYNLLGNGWTFFPSAGTDGPGVLVNDIKWEVSFLYPILNRKARGDWQITQVKIADTELALQQKQQEISTKIRQYAAEMDNLAAQIQISRVMVANYRQLLDAELEKFKAGESSIFLINTREQKWVESRLKLLKLIAGFKKAESGLLWARGAL